MDVTLRWETVKTSGMEMPGAAVFRAKVFRGWLVFVDRGNGVASGLAFVPDDAHQWTE
jgi:hypothetical protein